MLEPGHVGRSAPLQFGLRFRVLGLGFMGRVYRASRFLGLKGFIVVFPFLLFRVYRVSRVSKNPTTALRIFESVCSGDLKFSLLLLMKG